MHRINAQPDERMQHHYTLMNMYRINAQPDKCTRNRDTLTYMRAR